jgi:hypothetical protein
MKTCDDMASYLDPIKFHIEDKVFELDPKGYLIDGQDFDESLRGACVFGMMPMPSILQGTDIFILGDVFIRNFYSVFDQDND